MINKQCLSKQHNTKQLEPIPPPIHLLEIGGLYEIAQLIYQLKQRVGDKEGFAGTENNEADSEDSGQVMPHREE
jgi:hypothetical protein